MRSCKHTHVCCRLIQLRISPKDQRLQRLGRPPAAVGTHMCVAEQINAELHRRSRSTTFGRPSSAGSMHMCVAEQTNPGLHPSVEGCKGLADQSTSCCCGHKHVYVRHVKLKLHPRVCRVTRVCKDTHCEGACVMQNAPTDQGLQRFGRPIDQLLL